MRDCSLSSLRPAALGLLALALAAPALAAEEAPGHSMVTPDSLTWSDAGSLPPGAKVAVLEGDPAKEGPLTMRISFPGDYVVPAHTHPTVERVTVLEGTLYLGIGETFDREKVEALPEGSLAVMESGVPMYGYSGPEPVVIQINSDGPWGIDYLDPAADPRQKKE